MYPKKQYDTPMSVVSNFAVAFAFIVHTFASKYHIIPIFASSNRSKILLWSKICFKNISQFIDFYYCEIFLSMIFLNVFQQWIFTCNSNVK